MSSVASAAGPRLRDDRVLAPENRVRAATPVGPTRPGPDVHDLLADAARLARETLGANHASFLPADQIGRLAGTRPIVINDATKSAMVPEGWRDAFGIRSAAIAPVVVDGVTRGALLVGFSGLPHEFTENDVRLLEGLAGPLRYLLAVTDEVEGARHRQALLDRVTAAGRDLAAARTRHEVLQTGMEALVAVLGGTSCSVNVLTDDGAVDTLASRGLRQPEPGRHEVAGVDDTMRAALRALEDGMPFAQVLPTRHAPSGSEQPVLVPMTDRNDDTKAFVVVGRDRLPAAEPADLEVARALAAQAWLAYERAAENARQVRRVEFLEAVYALAEDALLDPDMERVLQGLAPVVRSTTGVELIDAFLADAAAGRVFATPTPNRRLAALIRRWRREPDPQPVVVNDLLVVPMVVEEQVLGVLRVRPGPPVDDDAESLVLAVAASVGGVVARVLLRNRMAENERGLAVAAERERVGRDLHDTLGQQLFALRVELDAVAATVTDRTVAARLREAVSSVSRANADLRLAIHALSFLEHAKRGLVPSLRTLVRKIADTTDIGLQLRVVGTPVRLNHGCEEALFRVAHEALANVVRHSRASTATLTISYSPERTSLIVRDDGTGMSARSDEQRGLHFGLRTMQRRMEEIGGGLDVSNFRPHGVCLHAWVPTA